MYVHRHVNIVNAINNHITKNKLTEKIKKCIFLIQASLLC